MTAGVALAQEFTNTRHVVPQDGTGAAACRTEFEFLLVQKKFMAAPSKVQLMNPVASRQYGSGAQVVMADPQDPQQRPYAVRLFSIAF
jgi:hypothetical protein